MPKGEKSRAPYQEPSVAFAVSVDEITKEVLLEFDTEGWSLPPASARELGNALLKGADSAEGILKQ